MLPRITVVNGTPYIAWLENSSNDALTLTGTNTVCYAAFDGSRWNEEVFSALSKPVISLAAGALNGQAAIAYTVDGDGDLANTLEDIELYAGAAGSAAKKITSNSVPEQNPQFAKVGGEDKLVWFADGSLFTTASFTGGTPELAVDVTVNGTSYKVDTGLTGSCLTYAAVYDTNGKMLTATGMSRLSSDSTAELTATVENLPATYEIRLFFLDDAYCPILDMVIIPSK